MSWCSSASIRLWIQSWHIEEKYIRKTSPLKLHSDIIPLIRNNSRKNTMNLNQLAEFVHTELWATSQISQMPIEDVYNSFTKKIMSEIWQN